VGDAVRSKIPYAEPKFWGEEERYALEALRSGWISGGPFVERLEAALAAFCGAPHVVATSNGTTALHCAYLGAGLAPGDEVIVPGFTFMAAANVALHMNAIPVFADVDPDGWCMTAETAERVITRATRGIVAVHTYGNMCDMQPILDLAAARGLWVIEDAAEALGSTYRGRQAGTIADIGTFSFHASKTIATGEGGAVATRNAEAHQRMKLYRSHGFSSRRYYHEVAGHNFRLPNVQAALGCAQLEQIGTIAAERRRVYRRYVEGLGQLNGIRLQTMTPGVDPLVWAVAVEIAPDAFEPGRDRIMALLEERGIETRPGFHAASEMPHIYGAQDLPVSTRLAGRVISLPTSPTVADDEVDYIVGSLRDVVRA